MTVTRATTVLKGEDYGIWRRKGVLSNDLIASVFAIANSKKAPRIGGRDRERSNYSFGLKNICNGGNTRITVLIAFTAK